MVLAKVYRVHADLLGKDTLIYKRAMTLCFGPLKPCVRVGQ